MALVVGFVVFIAISSVIFVGLILQFLGFKVDALPVTRVSSVVKSVCLVGLTTGLVVWLVSSNSFEFALQVSCIAIALGILVSTFYASRTKTRRVRYLSDLAHMAQMTADLIAGGADIASALARALELAGANLGLDGLEFRERVREVGLEQALFEVAIEVNETSFHVLCAHLVMATKSGSTNIQAAALAASEQAQAQIELELGQLLQLSTHQFELRALAVFVIGGVITTIAVEGNRNSFIEPSSYLLLVGGISFVAWMMVLWFGIKPAGKGFALDPNQMESLR